MKVGVLLPKSTTIPLIAHDFMGGLESYVDVHKIKDQFQFTSESIGFGTVSKTNIQAATGTGSLVVTANQPGNEDYNPAVPVSDTLQVFNSGSFIEGIGVFPNPAHGTLYIRMSQDYLITSYSMFDLSGRRVLGQETVTNGSLTLQVDIGNLMQGMYILKVVAIRNHEVVFPAFKIVVQ